jgi:hypothetical protein
MYSYSQRVEVAVVRVIGMAALRCALLMGTSLIMVSLIVFPGSTYQHFLGGICRAADSLQKHGTVTTCQYSA